MSKSVVNNELEQKVWSVLYSVAVSMPDGASQRRLAAYYNFFQSLKLVLPSKQLQESWTAAVDNFEPRLTRDRFLHKLKTHKQLFTWLFNKHNLVRSAMGRSPLPDRDRQRLYAKYYAYRRHAGLIGSISSPGRLSSSGTGGYHHVAIGHPATGVAGGIVHNNLKNNTIGKIQALLQDKNVHGTLFQGYIKEFNPDFHKWSTAKKQQMRQNFSENAAAYYYDMFSDTGKTHFKNKWNTMAKEKKQKYILHLVEALSNETHSAPTSLTPTAPSFNNAIKASIRNILSKDANYDLHDYFSHLPGGNFWNAEKKKRVRPFFLNKAAAWYHDDIQKRAKETYGDVWNRINSDMKRDIMLKDMRSRIKKARNATTPKPTPGPTKKPDDILKNATIEAIKKELQTGNHRKMVNGIMSNLYGKNFWDRYSNEEKKEVRSKQLNRVSKRLYDELLKDMMETSHWKDGVLDIEDKKRQLLMRLEDKHPPNTGSNNGYYSATNDGDDGFWRKFSKKAREIIKNSYNAAVMG